MVNPVQDLYFYGIVLKGYVSNKHGDDQSVIMIFKSKTREQTMDNFILDFDNILIGPCIVEKGYWSRGYFYNIGKIDITHVELNYGFYSIGWGKYFDEYGRELNYIPKYLGVFGISTGTGIAYEITQELIMDNSLLE